MTRVAEHINEMKKKYDAAVHAQEIQSLLHGWEVSYNVYFIHVHVYVFHVYLAIVAASFLSHCGCFFSKPLWLLIL